MSESPSISPSSPPTEVASPQNGRERSFLMSKKPLMAKRSASTLQLSNHRSTASLSSSCSSSSSSSSSVANATNVPPLASMCMSSPSLPILSPVGSDPASPFPEEDREHKAKVASSAVFTCELDEKLNPLDYVRVLDSRASSAPPVETAQKEGMCVGVIKKDGNGCGSPSVQVGSHRSHTQTLSRKLAIKHDSGFISIRKSTLTTNRRRGYGSIAWLDEEDSDDNICYNQVEEGFANRTVRGGTVKRLVQYLTGCMGTTFGTDFILTYSGFMEPHQLLDMILSRYDFLERNNRDATTLIRCVNIIKLWLTLLPKDFEDDPELVVEVNAFAQRFSANSATHQMLEKLLRGQRRQEIENREFVPEPIVFESASFNACWTLDDMHPEEIARQLWIIEDGLWKKIQPYEFMNEAWLGENKEEKAPNITEMIFASNVKTNWVMNEILSREDVKSRVQTLDKMIYVAEVSLRIHNYNAVMEIYAALQSSAIHRLKRTWELLAPEAWEAFDKVSKFVSSDRNFHNYREALRNDYNSGTPVIPYLGMYLTYLTFINQGNSNLIPNTNMINFNKWRSVSSIIQEVLTFQKRRYCYQDINQIKAYIWNHSLVDDDELYQKSLTIEKSSFTKELSKDEILSIERQSKEIYKTSWHKKPVIKYHKTIMFSPLSTLASFSSRMKK